MARLKKSEWVTKNTHHRVTAVHTLALQEPFVLRVCEHPDGYCTAELTVVTKLGDGSSFIFEDEYFIYNPEIKGVESKEVDFPRS